MTGRPPVSSTGPRKQPSRSSTHSNTEFVVPAPPNRSAKHHARTAPGPSRPPLASASASSIRIGYTTSNTTPPSYYPIPSGKSSESRQSLDPRVQQELQKRIVQVNTDAFVRAVLYKGAETRMKEDAKLAANCFDTLQASLSPHGGRAGGDPTDSSPQPPTTAPPTTSHPTDSMPDKRPPTSDMPHSRKPLLPTRYACETDMYAQHVALLNKVSDFFC